MTTISDHVFSEFGCDVFTDDIMRTHLSPEIWDALCLTKEKGMELTIDVAEAVAKAMMDWALSKGATHYTHWFQPMTGSTAEKHDSFLAPGGLDAKPILNFSAKALIKGEADGSSFPTGGLRATFEARGYTTWDCTSPAFIKPGPENGRCLCIPTAFCAFSGHSLDEKTPLLRSMEAINRQSLRVLRHLGVTDVSRVIPTVGGEQEYFLVDKKQFQHRKDLVYTGRTLFGIPPAKGQELGDQYYAATPDQVIDFMTDLDQTLWRLGVPAKTEHNEAAPSQYELAPLFASANVATDHNQIIMEMMRRLADKHGMICLLHEKPFSGINGSGKHNNWSLVTDKGKNLLKASHHDNHDKVFLTFFTAVIAAVDEYAGALRMSCATPGNQHRLGGFEAPPQIISVFVGNRLMRDLDAFVHGSGGSTGEKEEMRMGVPSLAVLHRDDTDRNRTSPFAFTGDKFEFRMVGSSQSLGMPNTVLNTIVAEELMRIADAMDQAANPEAAWRQTISDLIVTHRQVLFNGNNYAEEWVQEAIRRDLPIITNTVDAINVMRDPAVQDVFTRHGVLDAMELDARRELTLNNFAQTTSIEATTMLKMTHQNILPACIRYSRELSEAVLATRDAGGNCTAQQQMLAELCKRINTCYDAVKALDTVTESVQVVRNDAYAYACFIRDTVLPRMAELRSAVDDLERVVDKKIWPLPSYGELLYHCIG